MHRPRSVEIEWFAGGVRISWNQLQRRAIFTHSKYDSFRNHTTILITIQTLFTFVRFIREHTQPAKTVIFSASASKLMHCK